MAATTDTIAGRIDLAREELSPTTAAAVLGFGIALTFVLLLLQEPLVHDSLHNFRHAAGIVCH